ncbi:hypothetical protein RvY_03548-3 [Ramazzottius varieornatus]|uniref:Receptor ligand binding region domain-containing protein n=1 Tax=Ramazzottius varieornatus TaxID=947166 RepID=A0A1D1UNG9_RAMVA|nr:hypothetical protein RvY_03548-3 [Ramazzottius varieornatus]
MSAGRWFPVVLLCSILLQLSPAIVDGQSDPSCRPTLVILRNPSLKSTFIGTNWDDEAGKGVEEVYVDLFVNLPRRTMSSADTIYSTCAEEDSDTIFLLAEYFMSPEGQQALRGPCAVQLYVIGCSSVFDTAATFGQELNLTTMFVLDGWTKLLQPLRHLLILFLETYGLQTVAVLCRENEGDYFVASLCYELSREGAIVEHAITANFFYLPQAQTGPNSTWSSTSADKATSSCSQILSQALRTSNVLLLMLGPSDTEACLVAAGSLGVTTSQYVIISLNGSTEKNNISWRRISVAAPVFILNPESDAEELPLAEDLVYVSTRTVVSNFLFDVVKKTTDYSTFATNDTTNNTWSTTMMVSEGSTRRPWRSKANSSASRRLADNDLDHQGTSLSLFLPDGSTQLFAIVDPTQNETLLLLVSQESWAALWPNNEFPPIHAVWHNIDSSTIVAADYSFLAPVIVLLVLATVGAAYVLYDRRYLKESRISCKNRKIRLLSTTT